MAEIKTKLNNRSVEKFLDTVKDPQKKADCIAIAAIMKRITGCEPKMWGTSLIGYGSYHYKYASGREGDWPLTGFSPRKQNITMYIMPGFSRYGEYLSKLGRHKTGVSCLYINKLADVDLKILEKIIASSVKHMKTVNK
jgi:hypothetical protein